MKTVLVVVAACLVLAGCGSMVAGSPSGGTAVATTTTDAPSTTRTTATRPATTSTATEATPTIEVPASIDDTAQQRYCEHLITGALGEPMQVVVVETPSGRVDCDQAGAVLVDYYAERPEPEPGSDPIEVAGFACAQVPEPDLPQVICTDGDSLLFSMWPQT